jgi:hypothetical protein
MHALELVSHFTSHVTLAGPTVARLVIKTAIDLAVHKASHAGIHGISSRVRRIHYLIHKRGWLVDIAMLAIMTGFSAISEGGESHESGHAANE